MYIYINAQPSPDLEISLKRLGHSGKINYDCKLDQLINMKKYKITNTAI